MDVLCAVHNVVSRGRPHVYLSNGNTSNVVAPSTPFTEQGSVLSVQTVDSNGSIVDIAQVATLKDIPTIPDIDLVDMVPPHPPLSYTTHLRTYAPTHARALPGCTQNVYRRISSVFIGLRDHDRPSRYILIESQCSSGECVAIDINLNPS